MEKCAHLLQLNNSRIRRMEFHSSKNESVRKNLFHSKICQLRNGKKRSRGPKNGQTRITLDTPSILCKNINKL